MDVEDLVLIFIGTTTSSPVLRSLISNLLRDQKHKPKIESVLKELTKINLSKWTEIQITKYSKQLISEVTPQNTLSTMFKVSLHDHYRQLSGITQAKQFNSWERLLKILVMTETVVRTVIDETADEQADEHAESTSKNSEPETSKSSQKSPQKPKKIPQQKSNLDLLFGIADICVGFLNRFDIQNFLQNQGFSTESETESCCSSSESEAFSEISGIRIRTPIHDIISLGSAEEISSLPEENNSEYAESIESVESRDSDKFEYNTNHDETYTSFNTIIPSDSCQTVLNRQNTNVCSMSRSQLFPPILSESEEEEVGIAMNIPDGSRNNMKRHYKGSPNGSGLSTGNFKIWFKKHFFSRNMIFVGSIPSIFFKFSVTPKRHASASASISSHSSEIPPSFWSSHNLGSIASIAIISFGVIMLAKPTHV